MMRRPTIWMTALAVAAALLTVAAPAMAEETVDLEVRVIAAGVDDDTFDPKLEDLRSRLERGFRDYTSFEQINRRTHTVELDDSADFSLPTDDTLTLAFHGLDDDLVKLRLALGDRLDTSLRIAPGSTFFQAGLRYERRMLVLAITVE